MQSLQLSLINKFKISEYLSAGSYHDMGEERRHTYVKGEELMLVIH